LTFCYLSVEVGALGATSRLLFLLRTEALPFHAAFVGADGSPGLGHFAALFDHG
jgi:hypothetical protein